MGATGSRAVGHAARRTLRLAVAAVALAGLCMAAAAPAQATVTVSAAPQTYTGAAYFASVDASDPSSVVLVEWDFNGDGTVDANRTDGFEAGYTYQETGDFDLVVTVTRLTSNGTEQESNSTAVHVLSGAPVVSIVVPSRPVAGVEQPFQCNATDPDASPTGEAFTYDWAVDGQPVDAVGSVAQVLVGDPGVHAISVKVTDEEGVQSEAVLSVEFAAPGPFEGRQGTVNLALAVGGVSLVAGLALARAQRKERRATGLKADEEVARSAEEAVAPARRAKPEKVPFAAAAEAEAPPGGARIVHGGTPAPLARTKECPVCHSAIDADLDPADCPYCRANAEAEAIEATLSGTQFEGVDLSEVRALLQRARRERHLGRTDIHSELVAQARERAEQLVDERAAADEWLAKARSAVENASSKTDPERLDRAHSYLKLAESLSKAHQHGKVRRHAQRCVEILGEGGAGLDTPDRCHACGGAVAAARAAGAQRCPHCDAALLPEAVGGDEAPEVLEARVRDELHAVRDLLGSGGAAPDAEAWALLKEAEAFEQEAAWPQALELVRALRERFERERDAAGNDGPDGGGDPPAGE